MKEHEISSLFFLISSEKYIVLAISLFRGGIITRSVKDRNIKLSSVLELTHDRLSFAMVTSQP